MTSMPSSRSTVSTRILPYSCTSVVAMQALRRALAMRCAVIGRHAADQAFAFMLELLDRVRAGDGSASAQPPGRRLAGTVEDLELPRAHATDREQHLEGVAGHRCPPPRTPRGRGRGMPGRRRRSGRRPPRSARRDTARWSGCVELDQPVGEHVNVDDLFDVGYALGLGHRRRIDGMAGRPRFLGIGVDPQIGRERGVVRGVVRPVHRRCAVDHGAGSSGDLVDGALEGEPRPGPRVGIAIGMGNMPAAQIIDDVLLEKNGAERAGEVGEHRGEAVVEIRVDDDGNRLRGGERDGLERFGGREDVVVPVRLAEREILAEIADRGRARRAGRRRYSRMPPACRSRSRRSAGRPGPCR